MVGYFAGLNADARRVAHEIEYDPQDPEGVVRAVVDRPGYDGFKWKVWWVAASGFFTTSYSIFATNVISPALNYVYPECDARSSSSLIINLTTLAGTVIGMLLFGILADKYGRKSVYGLELSLVVVSTIGMTTASTGMRSMNIYGWIGFWRCLLGIGLGAECPLSAVIGAEWSSTRSRGTMMAAVFLMQSIGQLAAYAFGLAILAGASQTLGLSPDEQNYDIAAPVIDVVWRVTIGIGAVPALISLFLRRLIPETPLYLAQQGKVLDATEAAGQVYALDINIQPTEIEDIDLAQNPSNVAERSFKRRKQTMLSSTSGYFSRVRDYLSAHSRWRMLLGVMITWWLLDLAYYGLGLDNPRTISTIWLSSVPKNSTVPEAASAVACNDAAWRADPANQNITIYRMLEQDSIRNIITVSSGTVTGSIIILFSINYVPRVTWMAWMFVALAGLFAINGGTFFVTFETDKHALTMTLYVLAQVIFNLGPNTLTFILPAELFGTKYRATFYGLAAACGKLGAITIQLIVNFAVFGDSVQYERKFAGMLIGFYPAMLLGALVSWVWIPEVQFPRGYDTNVDTMADEDASEDGLNDVGSRPTFREQLKLPNRSLEDIEKNPDEGEVLGMRRNMSRLFRRVPYKSSAGRKSRPLMDDIEMGNSDNAGMFQHEQPRLEESDVGDGLELRGSHR